MMASGNAVAVVCRFRPLNTKELEAGEAQVVEFLDSGTVALDGKQFTLDRIFTPRMSQADVYDATARSIVEGVLTGYNGTVMAYGQTGSGKTHTMEGTFGDPAMQGVVPRAVATLFDGIDAVAAHSEFVLQLSAVEIYMERIRDLLRPANDPDAVNLRVHEDPVRGIYVDALQHCVASEADVFAATRTAQMSRRTAATKMNELSSRSHYIFMLSVSARDKRSQLERKGVLYLVDLAGSEKVGRSGAEGQVLEEAKKINSSLSCLGNVIAALVEQTARHVPYRDSKLTRLLQQSFGGNSRTVLITTCSPAASNAAETASTLRFGTCAKRVRNTPKVNEQRTLEQMTRELHALEHKCALLQSGAAGPHDRSRRDVAIQTEGAQRGPQKEPQRALGLQRVKLEATTFFSDDSSSSSSSGRSIGDSAAHPQRKGAPKSPMVNRSDGGAHRGEEAAFAWAERDALRQQLEFLSGQVARQCEELHRRYAEEKRLREEIASLRDAAAGRAIEATIWQEERKELQKLLRAVCSSGGGGAPPFEEERRQWIAALEAETKRWESARAEWEGYLADRAHRVVELEMEISELRDAAPKEVESLLASWFNSGVDLLRSSFGYGNGGGQAGGEDGAAARPHWNVVRPVHQKASRLNPCSRRLRVLPGRVMTPPGHQGEGNPGHTKQELPKPSTLEQFLPEARH